MERGTLEYVLREITTETISDEVESAKVSEQKASIKEYGLTGYLLREIINKITQEERTKLSFISANAVNVFVSETEPTPLKVNDIWIQL